jgi:predicted nucleic acid-binding protein
MLDSNLIIYAARPEYPGLRRLIAGRSPGTSAVSVVEAVPLSGAVVARAVILHQARRMSLGDALVAATALVFGRELLTRNIRDFAGVPGLAVTDPLADGDPT